MAIFASTTTSGYSDPLKAMSIKAMEQRLKDQQAQMAAQQPDAAMFKDAGIEALVLGFDTFKLGFGAWRNHRTDNVGLAASADFFVDVTISCNTRLGRHNLSDNWLATFGQLTQY